MPSSLTIDSQTSCLFPADKICPFSIAWWNTSLDPYGNKTDKAPLNVDNIRKGILWLCSHFDVVVLGEYVDQHELRNDLTRLNASILDSCEPRHMEVVDIHDSCGRMEFRNLLIVNRIRVACDELCCKNITNPGHEGRSYRIGQKIPIRIESSTPIDLFIVHWRQYGETDSSLIKIRAAHCLAQEIASSTTPFRICLGDFNAEPYSECLVELNSSRSESFAKRTNNLFNPFWRFLHGEGTLRYSNYERLRCDSPHFDQILISNGFLKAEPFSIHAGIIDPETSLWESLSFFKPRRGQHKPVFLTITPNQTKP